MVAFSGVNGLTPHEGVGSDRLTLPEGFILGATPGDMTLAEYLKPIDLATQRNRNRLELVLAPSENWYARIAFFREKRSGSESLGAVVGIARRADNYPAIVLPAPVDQRTENIEGTLGYQDPVKQWELNYQWSRFNNRDTTLTWDNPYNERSDYPQQAAISLDPDNRYYNLGFSGALNFAPRIRLVIAANMGKMRQDSGMQAYTINPDALITDPLLRSATQAEVETRRLHLKLSGKPLRRLSLNLGYNYDRSRNNTPVDLFQRVVNDTGEVGGTAQSAIDSSRANYNRPYQQRRSRLKLDSSYYFGRGTSLKIALFQEGVERSQRAAKMTQERGISARFNSRLSPQMSIGIGLQRDKRRYKGAYDHSLAYQPFYTSDYTDTVDSNEQFSNNPALRQYDIANRNRNNLNLTLNLYPYPDVVVGLYHTLNRQRYTEEQLGLDGQRQRVTTLDVSYTPNPDFTLFGYFTREWLGSAIDGREFNSAGPPGTKEATANDPENNWRADNRDLLNTVGAGSRFSLLRGDLTINIKAFYSREKNAIALTTAANLTAEPIPDDYASRRGVEVEADYYINRRLDVRLGFAYESLRDREWSRDLISPGSDASEELITLMAAEPDYTAYIVYTALRFKW